VTLSLHRAGQGAGSSRASIHFEVDDIDQTVERFKREGFTFACDPVDQPYLWREAIMLDLDGHHVFVYHVGENRLDPRGTSAQAPASRTRKQQAWRQRDHDLRRARSAARRRARAYVRRARDRQPRGSQDGRTGDVDARPSRRSRRQCTMPGSGSALGALRSTQAHSIWTAASRVLGTVTQDQTVA